MVFANLRVHLVHPHEVAALPVNALRDASVVVETLHLKRDNDDDDSNGDDDNDNAVVVETLHRARADAVLAEVVGVQVVLGCHLVRDWCQDKLLRRQGA